MGKEKSGLKNDQRNGVRLELRESTTKRTTSKQQGQETKIKRLSVFPEKVGMRVCMCVLDDETE